MVEGTAVVDDNLKLSSGIVLLWKGVETSYAEMESVEQCQRLTVLVGVVASLSTTPSNCFEAVRLGLDLEERLSLFLLW